MSDKPAAKINPKLPTGDKNGLGPIDAVLIDRPHRRHVLMMIVDCDQIATDTDHETQTPRLRILRVETVPQTDWNEAERLFRRAWAGRQYEPTLPYEGQADRWHDLFDNMDGEREDTKDWEMKHSPVVDAEVVSDGVDEVFNGPVVGPETPIVESDSTEVAIVESDEQRWEREQAELDADPASDRVGSPDDESGEVSGPEDNTDGDPGDPFRPGFSG